MLNSNLIDVVFSPFPTVAESIQTELDEYRASEEEVKRLKNVMVLLTAIELVSKVMQIRLQLNQ